MGALHINLGDQSNRVHVKAVLSYVELGAQGGLPLELSAAIKARKKKKEANASSKLCACLQWSMTAFGPEA